MSYAAGGLDSALSAVAAAHLDWCPKCRARYARMEMLGGLMLERAPVASLSEPGVDLASHSRAQKARNKPTVHVDLDYPRTGFPMESYLPLPIARHTGFERATIPWRQVSPGVEHYPVPLPDNADGEVQFIRVERGHKLPRHVSESAEATLVLWGSYSTAKQEFVSGDFADFEQGASSERVAGDLEGCIYLVAIESHPRGQNPIKRFLSPSLRQLRLKFHHSESVNLIWLGRF
ncbi:MAG: cupin domain-containing protein [Hyphomicrobiales bacterium]|nr:cupin domain-containing protein [Hyphomicrobiales bacterium]